MLCIHTDIQSNILTLQSRSGIACVLIDDSTQNSSEMNKTPFCSANSLQAVDDSYHYCHSGIYTDKKIKDEKKEGDNGNIYSADSNSSIGIQEDFIEDYKVILNVTITLPFFLLFSPLSLSLSLSLCATSALLLFLEHFLSLLLPLPTLTLFPSSLVLIFSLPLSSPDPSITLSLIFTCIDKVLRTGSTHIQMYELLRKRWITALRDLKGIFFQVVFPAIQILLILALLTINLQSSGRTIKMNASLFKVTPDVLIGGRNMATSLSDQLSSNMNLIRFVTDIYLPFL
jgi:hypothetical protein